MPKDGPAPSNSPSATTATVTSKRPGALPLLLLSLVYHLVFASSIFAIWFQSPVVQVPLRYGTEGLAKRVVLIVGDGLRADKLLQPYPNPPFPSSDPLPHPLTDTAHTSIDSDSSETTPAPFLRSLIQSGEAQWGISHTRVPTESRPGHVALIGGMYEDVSAVTRGWTTNPIPFDSVFNQSSHAFTFGSPDILPMFQRGASDPTKVDAWSYDEEAEDFSADAVHLDLWVLDQLEALLKNASTSPALRQTLDRAGTVFFLHLLGLDTTGHSYRPHGPEYHRNIRVVDHVVSSTVKLLNEYYGDDGETAFVFTADHGMSSLGNHGDGHPDNTRTPLVVWGKGVRRQAEWEEPAMHDEYSKDWGIRGVRRDVEQADVAPLMSVLAGIPIPANSAGRVPLEYLDASPSFRARAAFANANQLLAEAEAKSELKRAHALAFRPFPELVDSPSANTLSPDSHRRVIQELIDAGRYVEAEKHSLELLDIALRGSSYFQKYDWLLLRAIVTLGYLGFMAFTTHFVLSHHVFPSSTPRPAKPAFLSRLLALAPATAFLALVARFAVERAPLTYYLYALFPAYFWTHVLRDLSPFTRVFSSRTVSLSRTALYVLVTLAAVEAMAYGYTDRRIFAIVALGMGWAWPMFGWKKGQGEIKMNYLMLWRVSMTVLAVFPLLPVEKGEDLRVISVGSGVILWLGLAAHDKLRQESSPGAERARWMVISEMLATVAALVATACSAMSLQRKQGLPRFWQYVGWIVLTFSSTLPILQGRPHGQRTLVRLAPLLFAFGPAFIILSLSYEALFYAFFCVALVAWMAMESVVAAPEANEERERKGVEGEGKVKLDHVRVSLFFLAFLHLGFFGCGNVASISSFYLEPVYRLMTVFAPFPMGALLLFKLLIPFVALSAISSAINRQLRLPNLALFLVGSVLSEMLTITFFFRVTDTGSWLEIGSSITNFIICSLLGLFSSVLLGAGQEILEGTVG
ncbi:hypothetical protein JCM21900_006306 [Sporobolomyces salmonicolor]